MPYIESLRVFVRVVELGSITSGGRDLRLTPAVASKRIKELEARLGVRLLNRTTRTLTPTEVGKAFYDRARSVIESLEDAEAVVAGFSETPHGTIRALAPLGVGRRIIAPLIPKFVDRYPQIQVQLRLSDRKVDILTDGLDLAVYLGTLQDSDMKFRKIMDCDRVLCAAPLYLERFGAPEVADDLIGKRHNCLLLRYPRSPEYFWTLSTETGARKFAVSGSYDADDADVLTDWALAGRGIVNKPRFDVAEYLASGALVEVLSKTPPLPSSLGCLYPHRRLQDPKIRLFLDFVVRECKGHFGEAM